jgi:hypothetical protein
MTDEDLPKLVVTQTGSGPSVEVNIAGLCALFGMCTEAIRALKEVGTSNVEVEIFSTPYMSGDEMVYLKMVVKGVMEDMENEEGEEWKEGKNGEP